MKLRAGYFALFLTLSLCVYFVGITFSATMSDGVESKVRLGMTAALLVLALLLRRRQPERPAWRVFYALFVASLALYLSWRFSGIGCRALSIPLESARGLAIAKLSSAVLILAAVVLFVRAIGETPGSVFLRWGNLKLGLTIGLPGFAVLTSLAILQALGSGVSWHDLRGPAPWILVFILANGLLEEVLFRGLFLGRLEPLVGKWPANLLTAIAFTAAHMQVGYAPDMVLFLVVLFGLAVAWGYLMQKSESALGPSIFHAGADTLIMLQIFAMYGVTN